MDPKRKMELIREKAIAALRDAKQDVEDRMDQLDSLRTSTIREIGRLASLRSEIEASLDELTLEDETWPAQEGPKYAVEIDGPMIHKGT